MGDVVVFMPSNVVGAICPPVTVSGFEPEESLFSGGPSVGGIEPLASEAARRSAPPPPPGPHVAAPLGASAAPIPGPGDAVWLSPTPTALGPTTATALRPTTAVPRAGTEAVAGIATTVASTDDPHPPTPLLVEYYHTDAVGSVRVVTKVVNGQLVIVSRHDFMPFGEEVNPPNPPTDKRLFTGQEHDFETGQDHFNARQLAAGYGRFTTPDPVGALPAVFGNPQRYNGYSYAANNPLRFVDPTGLYIKFPSAFPPGGSGTKSDPFTDSTTVVGTAGEMETVPLWPVAGLFDGGGAMVADPTAGGTDDGTGGGGGATPQTAAVTRAISTQPYERCVDNFLTNNYGGFVGGKVAKEFSAISLTTNFWGYVKSSAFTAAIKFGFVYAPKTYGSILTTTGANLMAYPGMATAGANAVESGAFWATTAETAAWVVAPAIVGVGAFSTTADAYARWTCRGVK